MVEWDGSNFSEVGKANKLISQSSFKGLTIDKNNNPIAIGSFSTPLKSSSIAKWNDTSWNYLKGLSAGSLENVIVDTLSNIYACGFIRNSNGYYYVANGMIQVGVN